MPAGSPVIFLALVAALQRCKRVCDALRCGNTADESAAAPAAFTWTPCSSRQVPEAAFWTGGWGCPPSTTTMFPVDGCRNHDLQNMQNWSDAVVDGIDALDHVARDLTACHGMAAADRQAVSNAAPDASMSGVVRTAADGSARAMQRLVDGLRVWVDAGGDAYREASSSSALVSCVGGSSCEQEEDNATTLPLSFDTEEVLPLGVRSARHAERRRQAVHRVAIVGLVGFSRIAHLALGLRRVAKALLDIVTSLLRPSPVTPIATADLPSSDAAGLAQQQEAQALQMLVAHSSQLLMRTVVALRHADRCVHSVVAARRRKDGSWSTTTLVADDALAAPDFVVWAPLAAVCPMVAPRMALVAALLESDCNAADNDDVTFKDLLEATAAIAPRPFQDQTVRHPSVVSTSHGPRCGRTSSSSAVATSGPRVSLGGGEEGGEADVRSDGGTPEDWEAIDALYDLAVTIESTFSLEALCCRVEHHVAQTMHRVILPDLHYPKWAAHTKHFSGRQPSHAVCFLSTFLARRLFLDFFASPASAEFASVRTQATPPLLGAPRGDGGGRPHSLMLQVASRVLARASYIALREYVVSIANVRCSEARVQVLVFDCVYLSRAVRLMAGWMSLASRDEIQRVEIALWGMVANASCRGVTVTELKQRLRSGVSDEPAKGGGGIGAAATFRSLFYGNGDAAGPPRLQENGASFMDNCWNVEPFELPSAVHPHSDSGAPSLRSGGGDGIVKRGKWSALSLFNPSLSAIASSPADHASVLSLVTLPKPWDVCPVPMGPGWTAPLGMASSPKSSQEDLRSSSPRNRPDVIDALDWICCDGHDVNGRGQNTTSLTPVRLRWEFWDKDTVIEDPDTLAAVTELKRRLSL